MKRKTILLVAALVIAAAATLSLSRPAKAPEHVVEPALPGAETIAAALRDGTAPEVTASVVPYYGETTGYFARPRQAGSYPGVVMIHEWWGLNDNIKDMARQLAAKGYMVLAVDLYGQVAATREEAAKLVQSIDKAEAVANMRAAAAYLRSQGAAKIASMGWCFGGGQSLQLALSGEPLDATVIYYGSLVTEQEKLAPIQWPVLGIFGEKDAGIPVDTVRRFGEGLDALGVENDIRIYPGVGHAFANPSGANYAPDETKDAWTRTVDFLERNLK
jgi:carboxymethylenebutenolidase